MATVVVIGSGIAGLTAALTAAQNHTVTLVTKGYLTDSNTRYAQGGIAAALFGDDSAAAHAADTLRAGDGLCDLDAVRVLCEEGPIRVRELLDIGVPFDRNPVGGLSRGNEAAHSAPRILHAGGDSTGHAIETTLVRSLVEAGVTVLEHHFLADLTISEAVPRRATGVVLISEDGEERRYTADAVILATGGAGQLYAHTTNPAIATGDGIAAAWRAGAAIQDAEFYQFHPTALDVPGRFLISEAVRGEGAILVNRSGERFMFRFHPDGELAPRDIVARGIATEMAAQAGAPVFLDATALGSELLEQRFPMISRVCAQYGLDWTSEPIPVTPAAHYWMGGIATDVWGRTSVDGLFAIGEAACTGVHGANRLASNSLLEAAVFAHRAALAIDRPRLELVENESDHTASTRAAGPARHGSIAVAAPVPSTATATQEWSRAAVQELMWSAAGLYRSATGLSEAAAALAELSTKPATSTAAREDNNLLDLARLTIASALAREESRGAHYRTDYPGTLPTASHSRITLEVPVPC